MQTMEQFRDFEKYVKGVDPYGMQSGIVLIDPPEEWYVLLMNIGRYTDCLSVCTEPESDY